MLVCSTQANLYNCVGVLGGAVTLGLGNKSATPCYTHRAAACSPYLSHSVIL